jgi:DNA-binding NarL/FixJ family response regulator
MTPSDSDARNAAEAQPARSPAPVSVLIVDDNPVVRSGLRGLLEASPADVHVVGEAWDGERAVELARALQPDVVLLDVRMPRRDGVSAAREITQYSQVLMMTFTDDQEIVQQAVDAGAVGYLVHGSFEIDDLVASVKAAARGAGTFSASVLAALRAPRPSAEPTAAQRAQRLGLSERQGEIMQYIAQGMTNAQIAGVCYLSEKTVKNHINRIFAAMAVSSRGEAIATWMRAGASAPSWR